LNCYDDRSILNKVLLLIMMYSKKIMGLLIGLFTTPSIISELKRVSQGSVRILHININRGRGAE